MSVYGKLAILGGTLFFVVTTTGWKVLLAIFFPLVLAMLLDKAAIREIWTFRRLWLAGLAGVLVTSFWLPPPFFALSLQMLGKGVGLVLALVLIRRNLELTELIDLGGSLLGGRFGFMLGVAVNNLGAFQEVVQQTWAAARLRHGFSPDRLLPTLERMFTTILANTVRRAEEVTVACICRGYDGSPLESKPIRWCRKDLAVPILWVLTLLVGWWVL